MLTLHDLANIHTHCDLRYLGAKFYYLRGVLHDHPADKAREILERIKQAMTPALSVMLIDEMILPENGVSLAAASIDLTMMSSVGGMERTEAQWRNTLAEVGLELVETRVYNPPSYEGIMQVRICEA